MPIQYFKYIASVIIIFIMGESSAYAYTKQEIITSLTKAGEAYWDQKVVIKHSDTGKTLYGYSGQQTVIQEGKTRYYDTDQTFVKDPHIFVEAEDSKGPAGVIYAYVKAYGATGNKFFIRCAKALGDTLLQAQIDNNTGGWWHDMGVVADGVDHGRFVNYFPWGGSVHADPEYQHIGDNDGTSYLQAMALLRLEQALPSGDPDKRGKYLAGAKWYADTLLGLKDVTLERNGKTYHPYGNGGIPQMFPFHTVTDGRRPVDFCRLCDYPEDYPEGYRDYSHNAMITLNDDAMLGAVFFLGEFGLEAKNNVHLNEGLYLDAGRLNIDYLLDRAADLATPDGNVAWATAYYIQDGSPNANQPTWLRSMEPPGFYAQSSADDILVYWYKNIETDPVRLAAINSAMTKHALFWKYEAKVVNGDQAYVNVVAKDGTDPVLINPARSWTKANAAYDHGDPNSWYFWYVVNHDPATGAIGLPTSGPDPIKCSQFGDNCYTRTVGLAATYRRNRTNGDYYSYQEIGYPPLIGSSMGVSPPSHEIALFLKADTTGYDWKNNLLEYYHVYNPDRRFFYKDPLSAGKVKQALRALNNTTDNFFYTSTRVIDSVRYTIIYDDIFTQRMSWLAWGIDNGATGKILDSDGDGFSDNEERKSGSDILDSESTPMSASQSGKIRISNGVMMK